MAGPGSRTVLPLHEGPAPDGAESLGDVEAEIAPQILRGVIALSRMAEDALASAAQAKGAQAVYSVRIAVRPRWLWTSARATGVAVRLPARQ